MIVQIALISCSGFNSVKLAEPMGLLYLSSYLKKYGYSIDIFDPSIKGLSYKQIINDIFDTKIEYKVIGLSIQQDWNVEKSIIILKKLKKLFPKTVFVVGGHAPTIGILNNDSFYFELIRLIDIAVIGDGEVTFYNIIKRLEGNCEWNDILGIAYYDRLTNKVVINNLSPKVEDLDGIPFMDRYVLSQHVSSYNSKTASILGSRGCGYNHCRFCTISCYQASQTGSTYRQRSNDNIIEEIISVKETYGVDYFNFEDDDFTSPSKLGDIKLQDFCSKIKKINISFSIVCRTESIEFAKLMTLKKAGLKAVFLGIESFYPPTLKIFNKNVNIDKIHKAFEILKECNFSAKVDSIYRIYTGYILWHPMTTYEEILITIDNVKRYNLSPKILTRKLYIYRHSELEKTFKSYITSDNHEPTLKWRYHYQEIEVLYKAIIDYLNCIIKLRDKFREIEKTIGIGFDKGIACSRNELDFLAISHVEKIVNSYLKNKTIPEHPFISQNYISCLNKLSIKYNIDLNRVDFQRK